MKTLILVAALITGLTAGKAFAACSPTYESPLTASVTLADVDAMIASHPFVLTSKTYSSSNFAGLFGVGNYVSLATCDNSEYLILDVPYLDVNENGDGFKTGLDNVNFKFTNAAFSLPSDGASEVIKTTKSYRFLDVMLLNNYSQITFSMFATAGKLVSGETERILAWRLRTSDNTVLVEFYIEPVKVNVKACTVNTQDIEVSFDELTVKELKTPLATSGEETFAIKLSCGLVYSPVIMFSGNTDSEYTNVFTNQSGEGYAQGVGVQLLRNNTIITPGELLKLPVVNNQADFEFSGRVFSLAQTTTAGEIDIPVFFTLVYE